MVKKKSIYIHKTEPDLKGFYDKNLWRMKQFYETYKNETKLSTLLREISWSNNLANIQISTSQPDLINTFKDPYILDFLQLKNTYLEQVKLFYQ